MKTALCLYGYFNNKVDNSAGLKGYGYINDLIISKVDDVDIFIHSWDVKNKELILSKYDAKKCVIEDQINFDNIANEYGISQSKIDGSFKRNQTMYKTCSVNSTLSFLYSRSESIKMALNEAKNAGVDYDCIITCRFDLGFRSKEHRGYNVSKMNFTPELDMNYIYSAMWVQLNAGYADQWFFSNQKNMEQLSTMYDKTLADYFKLDSEYNKTLVNGWVDSNANNEFSNEMLKPTSNSNLIKYPQWQMINNHILHKWHFYATDLYGKSKFI